MSILGRNLSFNKWENQDVINNQTINVFPQPYKPECTPYQIKDFSQSVKESASANKTTDYVTNNLKVCKLIVLGDVSVGKTSIVNRFCHQDFDGHYKATIGVDFEVERFEVLNIPFNIQIWDTAGQERFKCIAQSYYRHAHVVLLVFDVRNLGTLTNCKKWLEDALKSSEKLPYVFLVGTKKDILEHAAFEAIEKCAIKTAKELNAEYWAVSAKTGEGVLPLFRRMVALSFNEMFEKEKEGYQTIKISSSIVCKQNTKEIIKKSTCSCN